MRILVTNDDGVHAEGIGLLARCAREVFDDVTVVAPSSQQTGASHALSLHRPLRVTEVSADTFAVEGTPVDAVYVALAHILHDDPPDLVLSGINHGPNVGYDVYYSGTVGAAREALFHGVPSVALSLSGCAPLPFRAIERAVVTLLGTLAAHPTPPKTLLNVNFPPPQPERFGAEAWADVPGLRGIRATRLGARTYGHEVIRREDPRGRPYYWIGGAYPEMAGGEGTDTWALREGFVSVTALGLDMTRTTVLPHLNAWLNPDEAATS